MRLHITFTTTIPTPLIHSQWYSSMQTTLHQSHGTEKACNSSLIGRTLSRLQCAMMMNNNVGVHTAYVTTVENVIADRISRIKRETNSVRGFSSILQDYPALAGCKRFQPSAVLISHLMDAISQKKFIDPMEVNSSILSNPGHLIS